MNYSLDALLYGMQFRRLLESRMEPLEHEYGLHRIDLELLYYLSRAEEHNTSSDMMAMHMFTRGHISQALTRLAETGYIRMETDLQDRRCTHNLLTDKALALNERTAQIHEEVHAIIMQGVTAEELEVLHAVAGKIGRNIQNAI